MDTLRAGNRLVLVAPTGSGKTTQVPQMLADMLVEGRESRAESQPSTLDSRLSTRRIVVLQPRRVAAMSVAKRVAEEHGGRIMLESIEGKGATFRIDGENTAMVVANEHSSIDDLLGTLYHEMLGHIGLYRAYKNRLASMMEDIYRRTPEIRDRVAHQGEPEFRFESLAFGNGKYKSPPVPSSPL